MENAVLVLIFFGVFIGVYFVPSFFAFGRNHRNRLAIFMTNVIFGWSLIGWVVSFIWSLTGNVEKDEK